MGSPTISVNGGASGDILYTAKNDGELMPVTFTGPVSYDTGGSVIALPSQVNGRKILMVLLETQKSGANRFDVSNTGGVWKLNAWTAFNTELANATDLSAVVFTALLVLEQ